MWRRQKLFCAGFLLCCLYGTALTASVASESESESEDAVGHRERRQGCQDAIANCRGFGRAACTQYHSWAQHNCPHFCGFCTGGNGSGSGCADVIDNCAALGPTICSDYVDFVHINCQKTCNLCGTGGGESTSNCHDKLNNCDNYGPDACGGIYEAWAKDNCALSCHLCPTGSTAIQGVSNVCYYKGHEYHEGDQWKDGCEKNCTCVDGHTGYYLCQDLCPTYNNLPAACHMETPPGQCCAKPVCPPATGCLYKGHTYSEGQEWNDGCQYHCICRDGTQGYYECRALCVDWHLLPACHLNDPAPGKCCPTPSCPDNIIIQYPDGYTPA